MNFAFEEQKILRRSSGILAADHSLVPVRRVVLAIYGSVGPIALSLFL
jgi:hypothetical protein